VLLQFPILIAMYSVLRWPQEPIHVPTDSALYAAVSQQIPETVDGEPGSPEIETQEQIDALDLPGPTSGTSFIGMNLLCSAVQAGNTDATLAAQSPTGQQLEYPVNCGSDVVDRIPYYVFAVLMFATTFFQQRQMQKASPPGASSQQQAVLKLMPILFGVFGIFFPAGLVLYWTTSNAWQIGQQYYMLRTRPTAETLAAAAADGKKRSGDKDKKGFFASMAERAETQRKKRDETGRPGPATRKPGTPKPGSGSRPNQPKKQGPGGSSGGDPKKRPKR
jgi:YidC/Oxa1 family membrane protein insertase